MKFMVVATDLNGAGLSIHGAVTRTKKQAFGWRDSVMSLLDSSNVLAWRYWDNGWADESPEAWKFIQSLPSSVVVEIYR